MNCEHFVSGICMSPNVDIEVPTVEDCSACAWVSNEQTKQRCLHLGTRLSVSACCGQMYACNLHKGKKCAPVGSAKDPFLSCSTCVDFESKNAWIPRGVLAVESPRIGFLSSSYLPIGGTETFHRTLLPKLRKSLNVIGFVATTLYGGDGDLLRVPYATGAESARYLVEKSDTLIVWGIDNLRYYLSKDRPRVIAVHHADMSSDWSNRTILSQLDMVDSIVCVNPDVAKNLQRHGKPVHYIPNAVDPERIRPSGRQSELRSRHAIPESSRIVLFGHRMSDEKRPCLAVEVAKHLPDGWVMVLVGDGPEKQKVDFGALNCGRVRVVGMSDSLADWLSISSCFLSLSTFEGFGLSVCEAMLAGVPTVSTPTGIAPGLAITLPTESTSHEWADAIVNSQQVATPAKIADMFSVDRMVAQWVKVVKSQ